jgi:uncharacterized RDD family membrane protein YckC
MQQNTSNLQLALMHKRAFAYIIDDLVITVIIMIAFRDSIMPIMQDYNALLNLMQTELLVPLVTLKVVYHTFFIWYYGATPGKMITKIRVIDAIHWGRVSIISAFLRAVGRIFSELFFYLGFLIGFFNEGRKTFHDFAAKTLVVNA